MIVVVIFGVACAILFPCLIVVNVRSQRDASAEFAARMKRLGEREIEQRQHTAEEKEWTEGI